MEKKKSKKETRRETKKQEKGYPSDPKKVHYVRYSGRKNIVQSALGLGYHERERAFILGHSDRFKAMNWSYVDLEKNYSIMDLNFSKEFQERIKNKEFANTEKFLKEYEEEFKSVNYQNFRLHKYVFNIQEKELQNFDDNVKVREKYKSLFRVIEHSFGNKCKILEEKIWIIRYPKSIRSFKKKREYLPVATILRRLEVFEEFQTYFEDLESIEELRTIANEKNINEKVLKGIINDLRAKYMKKFFISKEKEVVEYLKEQKKGKGKEKISKFAYF